MTDRSETKDSETMIARRPIPMKSTSRIRNGFTLIELLIAMALMGVISTAIYSVFTSQQRLHTNQQLVVDMQQNLRAAMYLIQRELHMAGFDPSGVAGAGFLTVRANTVRFTMDIYSDSDTPPHDGDLGDENENITYGFTAADDANADGIADAGAASLGRATGGGSLQPLADNIQAVGFAYAFDDDNDGELDISGGNVIWAVDSNGDDRLDRTIGIGGVGAVNLTGTVALEQVRAVRIWVLARTRRPVEGHTDASTYVVGNRTIVSNDSYQRLLLTATVNCRNMGLAN